DGSLGEIGRPEDVTDLVADRVGQVSGGHQLEARGRQAGLLAQLPVRRRLGRLRLRTASFRDLPRVRIEGITILPDQPDPALAVDRQDAHGPVLEVDHAVDARQAVPADYLVLARGHPRV